MQSKTIVHLCRRFYPEIGGVEKHVYRISQEMIKDGHRVIIITLQPSDITEESKNVKKIFDDHQETKQNQLTIYRIHSTNNSSWQYKKSIWHWFLKNRQILKEADIIQVHDVFWWIIPIYPWLRKKLFMTFHGYEQIPLTQKQKFWHQVAHKLTRASLAIGGFHEKWYGVKADIVCFGAVDSLMNTERKSKNIDNQLKILYLGRMEHDVGLMQYLRGLKKTIDSGKIKKKIILEIVGEGSLEKEAKKYVAENNLPVIFLGKIENASSLIDHYDLLFASQYLVILEGLAVGKPIIAFAGNQFKEDYLLQTPFADWINIFSMSYELAEKILVTPNLKLVNKAQEWAKSQTWQKMVENYYQIWRLN